MSDTRCQPTSPLINIAMSITRCSKSRLNTQEVIRFEWLKYTALISEVYFCDVRCGVARYDVISPLINYTLQNSRFQCMIQKYTSKMLIPKSVRLSWLPQARYYYFRFVKTKRRHLENIFPVSILTLLLPLACGFPSAYQISSKSDYPQQSYDVIMTFKMAAVSHVGFGLGQW